MPDSLVNTSAEATWPSYAAYVHALVDLDPSFEYLDRLFLRLEGPKDVGHLNIYEYACDKLLNRTLDPQDLGFLKNPPKKGCTRLVIFDYEKVSGIPMKLLDRLALNLNLSPLFLW